MCRVGGGGGEEGVVRDREKVGGSASVARKSDSSISSTSRTSRWCACECE